MPIFVIVHGGWGGGWEWTAVARSLRGMGHDVWTPTLTGMGERAHLGRADVVRLTTHVQDVVAVLEQEDLCDVVLCGHSYGGVPVTGAADRVPDRVRRIVYVDALVPRHGQSALDLLPTSFGDLVRAAGTGGRIPIPPELLPPEGLIAPADHASYIRRLRDQPAATFADAIALTGAVDGLPRAFVRCSGGQFDEEVAGDPVAPCAARARAEGWTYREVAAPHDPQLVHPALTAAVLDELAVLSPSEGIARATKGR